ncbi:MAG: DUF480 domain-containing protein [bacterium]|nr:DUF480 domain-containing protein [bacterium]
MLIEKSLAQPEYYPMTVNALVAACNQKNNRNPVMELDDDAVLDTLEALRQRGLITRIMPGAGSRVDRYRHEAGSLEQEFGWQKREQAVMAELLLRGPQTLGELRTRCSRMMPFENIEAVSMVLECLAQREPPMAAAMPRVPGQSVIRHTHLLYPEGEQPAVADPTSASPAAERGPTPQAASDALGPGGVASLRAQIDDLGSEVAELHQELALLKSRMDKMERQWS